MQLSLRPDAPGFAEVWISRYAEPEADGVGPVLRSIRGGQNRAFTNLEKG